MKGIIAVALLAGALLLLAWRGPARAQVDCETTRCAVQATIDQRCPCAQAATHGAYVRSCGPHLT